MVHEGADHEGDIDIGLTPLEVLELQSSEMEAELTSLLHISDPAATLSSSDSPEKWLEQTNAVWDVIKQDSEEDGCEYKKFNSATPIMNQLFPILVCDKTPGKSGIERHQTLDDLIAVVEENMDMDASKGHDNMMGDKTIEYIMPMNHATPNIFIRGLVSSAKVLYNKDEMTCWIMTCTSCLAMKLYADAVHSDGIIKVQPLLPMAKIREGTIDAISNAVASSQSQTLAIDFELSPSTLEFDSLKLGLSGWMLSNGRNAKTTEKEFKDAFPYTSMEIQLKGGFPNGEDPVATLWPHLMPMNQRNNLRLQIDLNGLHPGGKYSIGMPVSPKSSDALQGTQMDAAMVDELKLTLLAIIAAVVSKGEIISAQVAPDVGVGHRMLRGSYTSII
jgi:hypothetical protein